MAAPLYFLAGARTDDLFAGGRLVPGALAPYGLDEAFADLADEGDFARPEYSAAAGVAGHNGVLLSAHQPLGKLSARVGNLATGMVWTELLEGRTYLCVNDDPAGRAERVTPLDLQRHPLRRASFVAASLPAVRGYAVRLCDGQEWCVPLVRSPRRRTEPFDEAAHLDATGLPQTLALAQGALQRRLLAAHESLYAEYEAIVHAIYHGKASELSQAAAFDLAVRTLAVNYRLDAPLAGVLGLLDDDTILEVLQAASDFPFALFLTEQAAGREAAVPHFFGGGAPLLPGG